jgi:hypothetical protein
MYEEKCLELEEKLLELDYKNEELDEFKGIPNFLSYLSSNQSTIPITQP